MTDRISFFHTITVKKSALDIYSKVDFETGDTRYSIGAAKDDSFEYDELASDFYYSEFERYLSEAIIDKLPVFEYSGCSVTPNRTILLECDMFCVMVSRSNVDISIDLASKEVDYSGEKTYKSISDRYERYSKVIEGILSNIAVTSHLLARS